MPDHRERILCHLDVSQEASNRGNGLQSHAPTLIRGRQVAVPTGDIAVCGGLNNQHVGRYEALDLRGRRGHSGYWRLGGSAGRGGRGRGFGRGAGAGLAANLLNVPALASTWSLPFSRGWDNRAKALR